jgi:hypothetical protein
MAETAAGLIFEKIMGYDPMMEFGAEVKRRNELERSVIAEKGKAEALAASRGTTTVDTSSYLGGLFSTSQLNETGKEKSSQIEAGSGNIKTTPTSQSGTDVGKDKATGTGTADSSNAFSSILSGLSGVFMPLIIIIAIFIAIKLVK